MSLFVVSVVYRVQGVQLGLVFENEDRAKMAFARLSESDQAMVEVEDDYGAKATVFTDDVMTVMLSDYAKQLIGQGEIGKLQVAAQKRLQSGAADQLIRVPVGNSGITINQ